MLTGSSPEPGCGAGWRGAPSLERDRHERLRAVFEAIFRLPAEDRSPVLDRECGEDQALRAEVEKLLAHACRNDVLDDDVLARGEQFGNLMGGSAQDATQGPLSVGSVDGFRLIRMLGQGGMGAVWEAEQDRPRRRVALKVIRSAFLTEAMRRRFDREAEALGRLKHPGIAQIYAVGLGDTGSSSIPYIAMELVEGEPITSYARRLKLPTRDRLRLGADLCDAVEHAHQRGVIHRDLKPANMLVDGTGQPKILDFGVARMTESDLLVTTMQTEFGQILGTAAYMSPEQASGDPAELDTRSDVYSLGVVIYELLCGRLPVLIDRMPLPDAIRTIREAEPTRIGSINTSFRGDIDTILAKALEHDKSRRYQSASEFGADIRRFLKNEPIVARPPSTAYQLRKFARRNRMLVGGVSAVLVTLAAGLVATTIALSYEASARARAEQETGRAEKSLDRAEASSRFLQQVLLGLGPDRTEGLDTELLSLMLDRAESSLAEVVSHPEVQAEMLAIIGRVHHSIFNFDRAAELLKASDELYASLGPEFDGARDDARLILADSLMKAGKTDQAASMLVAAVDRYALLGDTQMCAQATRQLAELRMDAGQWNEALDLIERAIALSEGGPDVELGRVEMLHGAILRRLERLDEARKAYQHSLALFRGLDAKLETAIVLNSLGVLARDEGRLEDAERLYREAIELRIALDPRPNPSVAVLLSNLGRLLTSLERPDEAAAVLEQSVEMHKQVNGENHYTVAFPSVSLGETYSRMGEHDKALPLFDRGLELIDGQFGHKHPVYVSMLTRKAEALRRAGLLEQSRSTYEQCLTLIAELPGNRSQFEIAALRGLAETRLASGDREGAVETLQAALERLEGREREIEELRSKIEAISSGKALADD